MVARSRRKSCCRHVGLLAVLVAASLASEAHATIAIFSWNPSVTGGTFVDDNQFGSASSDRLSMSMFGDYSFVANSNSATVTISAFLLPLNPQGSFSVNTSIDGSFASDLSGTTAQITEYSASTYLFHYAGFPPVEVPVAGSGAIASIASVPITLPTATSDFPLSSLHLQASASTAVTIAPNDFGLYLGQLTTIQFDGLTAGETIRIDLPDDSSLTPAASVPEPPSLVLLGLGSLIAWGATRLRTQKAEKGSGGARHHRA
jgi:hypothetical protein